MPGKPHAPSHNRQRPPNVPERTASRATLHHVLAAPPTLAHCRHTGRMTESPAGGRTTRPRASPSPGGAPPPPPHACPFALCRYAASAPTALARAAPGAQAEPRRVSPPLPRCGACCPLHRPAAPSSDSSACQRSAAAPVALLFEQGNSKEASRSTPRPLPSLTSRSCGLTAPRRRWPGRAARTRCGTAHAHARRPAARGGPAAPDRALQRVLATAGECCAASPRVRPRGSEAGALRRLRQLAVVRLLHLLPQVDQDGLHRLLARPVPQRVKVARVHLRGAPQHLLYCRVVGPLVSHRRGQEQARLLRLETASTRGVSLLRSLLLVERKARNVGQRHAERQASEQGGDHRAIRSHATHVDARLEPHFGGLAVRCPPASAAYGAHTLTAQLQRGM